MTLTIELFSREVSSGSGLGVYLDVTNPLRAPIWVQVNLPVGIRWQERDADDLEGD